MTSKDTNSGRLDQSGARIRQRRAQTGRAVFHHLLRAPALMACVALIAPANTENRLQKPTDARAFAGALARPRYDPLMFVDPDWSQPIDFAARLAAIPATSLVRGMFLQLLVDAIGPIYMAKRPMRRYSAFKNYPLREYVELLSFGAEHMRKKAPAECVRRLGWRVYPSYAKTITGTAIFAVAGYDFRRIIELSPTAYRVSLEPAEVRVKNIQPQYAEVELRNMYNIPDLHQVGIWEGAMQTCGVEGHIKTEVIDFGAVNFELRWQPRPRLSGGI